MDIGNLKIDKNDIYKMLESCIDKNNKLYNELNGLEQKNEEYKIYNKTIKEENEKIKSEIDLLKKFKKDHRCPNFYDTVEYKNLRNEIKRLQLINEEIENKIKTTTNIIEEYNKLNNVLTSFNIRNIDELSYIIENNKNINENRKNYLHEICNNYNKNNKIVINNNEEIKIIQKSINNNYNDIYFKKSNIIYNYYEIYYNYLNEKKNNNKLLFENFIFNKNINDNNFIEKVKMSYKFFNELLTIVEPIPGYLKYSKVNVLIDILKKCKITENKLQKLEKDEYTQLINFLKPIILDECKKKYEIDKLIYLK